MKKCGYTVIEAQDGLQAVDIASKLPGRIDLVVTDVVMPGMSGGQLAEILGARYPAMKVLFVSGYAERVVLKHKIVDVHTNFLQKPLHAALSRQQDSRDSGAEYGCGGRLSLTSFD